MKFLLHEEGTTAPEDDSEWQVLHNEKMVNGAESLAAALDVDYRSSTNDDRYKLLRDFMRTRKADRYEHMNGGNVILSAEVIFSKLEELKGVTESFYIKRYIDWIENQELHEIVASNFFTEVDESKSDPALLREYYAADSFQAPKGLIWRYTDDFIEEVEDASPTLQHMYARLLKLKSQDPTAGDEDYYAPDPFREMVKSTKGLKTISVDDVEFAAETAHLFGFDDIRDLTEEARARLYHFGVNMTDKTYGRIEVIAQGLTHEDKKVFAEAFLATEFGDDFGDVLLAVAENLPKEQLTPLLEKIGQIREYGARFAEQFKGFDDNIVGSIKRAIGERVTEVLYVAKELMTSPDGIATGKVLGNRITVTQMDEVRDAMDLMCVGLQREQEAEASGVITGSYDEENRTGWHLGVESDVLIQIKPRGERLGDYKKGVEHSEEAQINYSIDVISEHGDYVPTSISNYRRRYALSMRLDLEGIIRDNNGGKIGFDATRDQLAAAFDIGSLRGNTDNPNVRVARIISLGNKLRKRELGQGRALGYHTGLPEEYGTKAKFAGLAEFMKAKYRARSLGRGAVATALGRSLHQSSASQSEKAAA